MKIAISILLAVAFGVATFWFFFTQDYSAKREWSVVQGAEHRGRDHPRNSRIEYYEDKEFGPSIGIQSLDGERIWILGNAKYGETLKVLPKPEANGRNRIRLSQSEFESIRDRVELSDDVALFLKNSVDPSQATKP